jgi:hypothetical protein
MQENSKEIVQVVEGKVKNAVKEVEKLKIKTDEDLNEAATLLTNIKKLGKWVTGEKEKIVKPMREAMNAARGLFSPLEEKIEDAEKKVKSAMIEYQTKKEAEHKKKMDSIEKRAESGQLKEETAVRKVEALGEVKTNLQTETGAATFKKTKAVRVIDKEKVPDEYWIIDMVTLRSAALNASKLSGKIGEVIPGVEVYEEMGVAGRV